MNRIENHKVQIAILLLCQVVAIALLFHLGIKKENLIIIGCFTIFNIILVIWTIHKYDQEKTKRDIKLQKIVGKEVKEALEYGKVGIIIYNEDHIVNWYNDFLADRGFDFMDKKITTWHPQILKILIDEIDVGIIESDGYIYRVEKQDGSQTLFVQDVTQEETLKRENHNQKTIVGFFQLDNYLEVSQYEDEAMVSDMSIALRKPIYEWGENYGFAVRRVRSDRFVAYLNEEIFEKVLADKFTILETIRKNAEELGVSVTLSMGFAKGDKTMLEKDRTAVKMLELAQSRGGDQVVVKHNNEDAKYYGGKKEATEKNSKVRVGVMVGVIKSAIKEADNVYIVGHSNMDYDCMASSLLMSRICKSQGTPVYIVSESGGIEESCKELLDTNIKSLKERHNFITDEEASQKIKKNDLVIAVDFHNPTHCNAPMLLEKCNKVIIIDHHRKTEKTIDNPLLIYTETSASSASEMIIEFIPFMNSKFELGKIEALFLYLGILIDSNKFKVRTGGRTFEACAILKDNGLDINKAEEAIRDEYDDFGTKNEIAYLSKKIMNDIVISVLDNNKIYTRTDISKGADYLLTVKGMEASFVVAKVSEDDIAISARSKGYINVQKIMEMIGGGGHFTAAAYQTNELNIEELAEKLKTSILDYISERG